MIMNMKATQTSERSEYLKKVWNSCETEEERMTCENWIRELALAGEITRAEKNNVLSFIDKLIYSELCTDPPLDQKDDLREIKRSEMDLWRT